MQVGKNEFQVHFIGSFNEYIQVDISSRGVIMSSMNPKDLPNNGAPNYGASNYGAPNYGSPNYGAPNYGAPNVPPPNYGGYQVPNYMVWAILELICCCLPLGIVGLVYSLSANRMLPRGEFLRQWRQQTAQRHGC